ncbi:phosphoglycolate phosphatase 1B, chloroplastic isoform X7 [Prunus persica]|uniref:phosphoglycolate phosphatase 1B, chloroplastic isoform X7 n=1 Tax=Prunus persica TaxID=3760 RepID=UPI0009AB28EA|nr:phosphoglycolate phosphatase 1B, chloroplastic isoform X7 [Prunus persica]
MDSDEVGVADYEFIDNDSDNSNDVASHRYQVYVIGEEGILKELELAGYQYLGGPEDGGKKIDLKPGFLMEHDENSSLVAGDVYVMEGMGHSIRENP